MFIDIHVLLAIYRVMCVVPEVKFLVLKYESDHLQYKIMYLYDIVEISKCYVGKFNILFIVMVIKILNV